MRRLLATTLSVAVAVSLAATPASAAQDTRAQATPAAAAPEATLGPAASPKKLTKRYGKFKAKKARGTGTQLIRLPKKARSGLVTI